MNIVYLEKPKLLHEGHNKEFIFIVIFLSLEGVHTSKIIQGKASL